MHPSGTRALSDDEFVAAMESGALPAAAFRHYDHLRLAWIYLRREGLAAATARIRETIRRFAAHHGATGKYHETLTVAYMRFVAAHLAMTPELGDFDRFAEAHPALFESALPSHFYSSDRLWAEEARSGWVEPDLRPLP
jgi:hypothetical protein